MLIKSRVISIVNEQHEGKSCMDKKKSIVDLDLNWLQHIVPFILVVDADQKITYGSIPIVHRVNNVLGQELAKVIEQTSPVLPVSGNSVEQELQVESALR